MANISRINALPTWGGYRATSERRSEDRLIGGDSYGC